LRGAWLAGLLALVGLLLIGAWTAVAQSVVTPTTPNPLPGSQFQGGDGNQANAPGLIDWQGLEASSRVGYTSDPQANDDVFAGGTNELDPGGWALTTQNGGATPSKANVLDIYRAIDRPPGGDVFLYLAFTREAGNGTTFVTFELTQQARLWRNSAGDRLPCRTTGDILISFDQNGNGADVEVQRWVTDTSLANGCANTGHLVAATDLTPNVDVQASFNNDSAIANYLPGFFGATIPQLQFGEAAINLSTVLGDLGHPCGAFHSTWMHSRSSLSDSSQLQDFVAPRPFHMSTCKADPDLISSASGRVNRKARGKHRLRRHRTLARSLTISDTATLSGGDDPTGSITFKLYGPNGPDCSNTPAFTSTSTVLGNGSYQSGAYRVTQPGTYRWVVSYSGDDNNQSAGPTGCGDNAETVVINPATPTLTTKASGPVRRRRINTGHGQFRTARVHTGRAAQPTFDTATMSGGIAATGTITFMLYGPDSPDCMGTPVSTSTATVNGDGTYNSDPYEPTAAGTYRWVATYSGDALNDPAGPTACGDPTETVTISKARTTIKTVASPTTAPGNQITDTATVGGGADPGGSITFTLYGPNDPTCSGGAISTSTRTVNGNGKYTSDAFTPTADGIYRWIAAYSGDANNTAVSTSCGDAGETVVVAPLPPTHPTLTTSSSGGGPAGSPIHDVAHLSSSATAAGASITFELYGPNDPTCTGDFVIVSTVPVTGDGDYTSVSVSPTAPGTYDWIARYSGDANNAAVDTACGAETVTVSKAQPGFSTLAPPRVPITGVVIDTATLSGSDPRGKITFSLYGPNDSSCSRAPVFSADQTVIGDGTYTSPEFAPAQAGTYLWIAAYSGDANNTPATPACGDSGELVVVPPIQPALITSAGPPAFLRNGRRRVRAAGQSIYDSAELAGFAPTGSITFDLFGPDDPTCSAGPVFTSATVVNGNGVYNSDRFTPTASGTYRWRATYSGDNNNNPAGPTGCGEPAEQVHVIVPADPQFTTSASGAVSFGGAIYDTAHLSGGENPTGTITFKLYGASDTGCSEPPVFTSTVTVAGNNDYTSASFVPPTTGVYRWVASYSGDAINNPAGPTACGDTAETAVVRPPTITPVAPTFSTTAAARPAGGTSLYDTAHLAGGIDPGGTITFTLYGPNIPTCSGPPAFTTTLTVTGNGDYRSATFAAPLPGTYRWVVTYSGDAMNAPAGPSACGDPAETATVSSSPRPSPDPGPNVPRPPTFSILKPGPPTPPSTPPPPPVTG
jgi:hypothetical protein